MFKRYSLPGRRLRPARDPLAGGDAGPRRGARPVPPLHRHRPDDPRLLRRRDARRRRRLRAVAAARRLDALLVRRRRRADAQGDPVLRDARHARHLAQGLEGGHRARPDAARARATSTRTAGSSSTPTRTAPRRTTSPSSTPRRSKSSSTSGSQEAKKYDVLPLNDLVRSSSSASSSSTSRCRRAARYTYYPGTTEVPEQSAANTHGVSYKVLAEVEFTRRARRA